MPNNRDDQFLLLLEKMGEISDRTARMEGKVELIVRDVEQIKAEDAIQNKLLAEHIQGTITNRERLEVEIQNRRDLEAKVEERARLSDERMKRVEALEEPGKVLNILKKYVAWIAAFGASAVAIYEWFK